MNKIKPTESVSDRETHPMRVLPFLMLLMLTSCGETGEDAQADALRKIGDRDFRGACLAYERAVAAFDSAGKEIQRDTAQVAMREICRLAEATGRS